MHEKQHMVKQILNEQTSKKRGLRKNFYNIAILLFIALVDKEYIAR